MCMKSKAPPIKKKIAASTKDRLPKWLVIEDMEMLPDKKRLRIMLNMIFKNDK